MNVQTMNHHKKVKQTTLITAEFLRVRAERSIKAGYGKQRWIQFCEELLNLGCTLYIYEARKTFSKYITVQHNLAGKKSFKVRFSDHKPIPHREANGDCDFFAGKTNFAVTNTSMALDSTKNFF